MNEEHYRIADLYKTLSNPKRVAILDLLMKGEISVDDISKKLKLPKTNVSQHLSHLRLAGLVKPRRDGLRVYYKLIAHEGLKKYDILKGAY
ncbi:MAG: metalloregulator ArsR/SmtB family transcription factor [Candidatus Paceibacterota bacterium]|jgi:ArsR family transcriptional regulator